jgi:sulfur carrier protein
MTGQQTSPLADYEAITDRAHDEALALVVNGEPIRATSITLADLLVARGFDGATVATAVNGDFVPAGERPDRKLQPGDHIEVLSPRQGG